MRTWAAQFSRPSLVVRVTFTDNSSEEFDLAAPTTRDVTYKVDGEEYSIPVDMAKFDSSQFDLYGASAKEIISAFETWLQNAETKYSKIIRLSS